MTKKFYITTSIPYANSTPHIGNVLDSVYADVLARFYRQREYDTRFLTGTDEHGAKIARTAKEKGITPQELVDQNSARFRALKDALNLSWDDFIRTSDRARHWPGAQKMWNALADAGDLYKKIYKGLYCVGHEAFVTEKDLDESGVCRDHRKKPEIIEEENWFFRLSKYSKEIESRIKNDELRIVPEGKKNEILALLREGLEDVSFSRPKKDLSWGVPVPARIATPARRATSVAGGPDDNAQTMYVWAEALVNYISALGYGSKDESDFNKYWPADVQVIGKDNLRFHAAIWPGMLLATGIPLPKTVFVHGFLNVEGQKISKSVGNVIDPFALVEKYGTDPVRFYLLREVPPFEDGDFSYAKFEDRYNGDLANGLGNFAARVLTLGAQCGMFNVKECDADPGVVKDIAIIRETVEEKVKAFKFHEALAAIWELVALGDKYANAKEPWKIKDEAAKIDIIYTLITILDNAASLLQPFLPVTAKRIAEHIVRNENTLEIKKSEVLFPRLA